MIDGRPVKASEREKRQSGRHWRSYAFGEEDDGSGGVEGEE